MSACPILCLLATASLSLAQQPNPACTALTANETASVIGAAQTLPVGSNPRGSSCMLQNGDKMLTVLIADLDSEDAAQHLGASKKRIVSGQDLPGIGTTAYAGTLADAAVVGAVKGKRFIEVKAIDKTQKVADLAAKLKAVLKTVVARL